MPRIDWSVEFSVNNSEIDNQHKKWVEIHNKLHEVLLSGNSSEVSKATLTTIESMKDYVQQHFAFEEDYMKSIGFPELDKHTQIHRDFEKTIQNYIDEIESGSLVINTEILKVLKGWLENHILYEDKKYAVFGNN